MTRFFIQLCIALCLLTITTTKWVSVILSKRIILKWMRPHCRRWHFRWYRQFLLENSNVILFPLRSGFSNLAKFVVIQLCLTLSGFDRRKMWVYKYIAFNIVLRVCWETSSSCHFWWDWKKGLLALSVSMSFRGVLHIRRLCEWLFLFPLYKIYIWKLQYLVISSVIQHPITGPL